MLTYEELASGDITLPKFRAPYLDEQLRQGSFLSVQKGKSFRELIRNMKQWKTVILKFRKNSRKYCANTRKPVISGWKPFARTVLVEFFADDMGLGKTLQVIVFLYAHYIERQETHKKYTDCLPASLVYNWETGNPPFCTGTDRLYRSRKRRRTKIRA